MVPSAPCDLAVRGIGDPDVSLRSTIDTDRPLPNITRIDTREEIRHSVSVFPENEGCQIGVSTCMLPQIPSGVPPASSTRSNFRVRKRGKLAERVEAADGATRLPCLLAGCFSLPPIKRESLRHSTQLTICRTPLICSYPSCKGDGVPERQMTTRGLYFRYDRLYRFSGEHDIPSLPSYAYMSPSLYMLTRNL